MYLSNVITKVIANRSAKRRRVVIMNKIVHRILSLNEFSTLPKICATYHPLNTAPHLHDIKKNVTEHLVKDVTHEIDSAGKCFDGRAK